MKKKLKISVLLVGMAVILQGGPAFGTPGSSSGGHAETRIWGACSATIFHNYLANDLAHANTTGSNQCVASGRWLNAEVKEMQTSTSNGESTSQTQVTYDYLQLNLDSIHKWCVLFCGLGTYSTVMY